MMPVSGLLGKLKSSGSAGLGIIGVSAVFDDSQMAHGIERYNKLLDMASMAAEQMAKRTEAAMAVDARAFEVAEAAAASYHQTLASLQGVVPTTGIAAPGAGIAGITAERQAFSQNTFGAIARRIALLKQQEQVVEGVTKAEKEVADATSKTTEENKDAEAGFASSFQALRQFRWGLITVLFTIGLVTAAVGKYSETLSRHFEEMGRARGAQALAAVWGANLRSIVDDMQSFTKEQETVAELVAAAQAGMLADQGEFTERYGELWGAAVLASRASGEEAVAIFESLLKSLADGKATMSGAASAVFQLDDALAIYAQTVGKSVDELSDLEREQVMFNRIQEVSNALAEAGAASTADQAQTLKYLKDQWAELWATIIAGGAVEKGVDMFTWVGDMSKWLKEAILLVNTLNIRYETLVKLSDQVMFGPMTWSEAWDRATEAADDFLKKTVEARNVLNQTAQKSIALPRAAEDELSKREDLMDRIIDQLEAGYEAIQSYNDRVEDATRQHYARLRRMLQDYNNDMAAIDRRFDQQRDRAIRTAQQRYQSAVQESQNNVAEMTEQHYLEMHQLQERYNLSMIQNERIYQYERRMLVAEGDVLAIEDLDARHDLEQQAAEENKNLQIHQMEEMFQLQLKYMQQANREMLRELRRELAEELREIETRRQEEQAERAASYKEQIAEAQVQFSDQLTELEDSLNDQLEAIGAGLEKQAAEWAGGYDEVTKIIDDAFGPTGRASVIMDGFIARYQNITLRVRTYMDTGTFPGFTPSGGGGGFDPYSRYGNPLGSDRRTLLSTGGDLFVSWAGGAIPINVSGGGQNMQIGDIGSQIAEGIVIELDRSIAGYRGQRGR